MTGSVPPEVSYRGLIGRRRECEELARRLKEARGGRGAVLVVRGEAGVGKSALLDHIAESASELAIVRAAGVASEKDLEFAALHRLCAPMFDRLERLAGPHRDALTTAFGLTSGPTPDRFLVGLAVLSLLSQVADGSPLVCLVDDAQSLDRSSLQALAFAGRRLRAEPILLLFATQESGADLSGMPELALEGLPGADARRLLDRAIRWPLDEQVRERIIAETRGNPRALLDLARDLPSAQLAGGFGLPAAPVPPARIEHSLLRRVERLPEQSRRLLLVAAADPFGDAAVVWRAAGRLGIPNHAAIPAAEDGLVEFNGQVRFRHLLIRSATYLSASPSDRQDAHRALAEAIDARTDPDRRAWHRAHATPGLDEDVAAELERSARRAQARGGMAARAAFLERAATLTPDAPRRAERALAAAQAMFGAGAPEATHRLLALAQAGPLDEVLDARIGILRGQMACTSGGSADAAGLLLHAAQRLRRLDYRLGREAYLYALAAAVFAGRLSDGVGLAEVARAARDARSAPQSSGAADLLLDALAILVTEGHEAGTPMVRRALDAFRHGDISGDEELCWYFMACHAARDLWDDEGWSALTAGYLRLVRDRGALGFVPIALSQRVVMHLHTGEFEAAASLADEMRVVAGMAPDDLPAYGTMAVACSSGRYPEAHPLIRATTTAATARGEGMGLGLVHYCSALLYNGLGRYADALTAAEQASEDRLELGFANWGLVELIEAAVRCGERDRATDAMRRLSASTTVSGSDWALGIQARARALLSRGESADRLYREAIERLDRTRLRMEQARAHLLYGEWLRREGRRVDAREHLRVAHETLSAMGAEAFAERAKRELEATGATARRRAVETSGQLTPQEAQIARLARDGLSNPEIGGRLFISPRTVEWHLRKIYTKLGIASRRELRTAMPPGNHRVSSTPGTRK